MVWDPAPPSSGAELFKEAPSPLPLSPPPRSSQQAACKCTRFGVGNSPPQCGQRQPTSPHRFSNTSLPHIPTYALHMQSIRDGQ